MPRRRSYGSSVIFCPGTRRTGKSGRSAPGCTAPRRRYSALALATITDTPLSFEVSGAMKEDFSESDLPFRVDILDWAVTQAHFRTIVERDKVVVQPAPCVSTPDASR